MTVLLRQLIQYSWIVYILCAGGILVYALRAVAAQRERSLALFTLEREIATSNFIRALAMIMVFIAIGVIVFVSTTFVVPNLSIGGEALYPTSTLTAGLELPTATATNTPLPTLDLALLTATPTLSSTVTPPPTAPLPTPVEPTEVPTPEPTSTPAAALSGEIHVRFGDFAELVGFSVPAAEMTRDQPLVLTLYWLGTGGVSPMNYVVFTHLLSEDGRLIAQHDGPPAGGTRPTTTWAAGETIVDVHPMSFYETDYIGAARIAVGLYDPATGRVPTSTGSDHVLLPVTIFVR